MTHMIYTRNSVHNNNSLLNYFVNCIDLWTLISIVSEMVQ